MVQQLQHVQQVQNSIGEAFKIVQRGDADAMITGAEHQLLIWQLQVSVQVEHSTK